MISVRFLGADREVTGSCYLLDYDGFKVMIDCGMYQGDEELEKRNGADFLFDPKEIDAFILTHAHLDHCGLLPKLVKHGYKGKIYLTPPSKDLLEITAYDTAKIQKEDALMDPTKPIIYTAGDVVRTLSQCVTVKYDQEIQLTDNFSVTFKEAGHIMGAAYLQMQIEDKKVVFSGDVGHKGQSIIKPLVPLQEADYLIIESTYANRLHKPRIESEQELAATINESYANKGNIIMPCFAIERTQEIIYTLKLLLQQNKIPRIPIYIDSPMAGKVTQVFAKYFNEFNTETKDIVLKGDSPFYFDGIHFVQDAKRSRRVAARNIGKNKKGDSIMVLAGSGMCTGGRILTYLQRNLPLARSTIVFPGFQAEGTLGREIVDGAKEVRIYDKPFTVRSKIVTLGGFSAHADKADLTGWIAGAKQKPKKVFICHGDEQIALEFSQTLGQMGIDSMVPYYDTTEVLA